MRRVLILGGLAVWLVSCANNGGADVRSETGTDTTENMTTNSGAAGTGGVGAGFGTGGSAGTDTNTLPGAAADTSRGSGTRQ